MDTVSTQACVKRANAPAVSPAL